MSSVGQVSDDDIGLFNFFDDPVINVIVVLEPSHEEGCKEEVRGYIAVFKHPYFAVTNKDGASDLKNVPPGKYTNEAWHEKFGVLTQKVTIAPNQTKLWSLFSSDEVDLETMQVPA